MGTKKTNIGQYADLLLRVNNDLAVSDSLIQALDTLINITSSVIGTERGTVFIHDNETQEIYSFVAQGNLKREIRFMSNQGIAGWVFTNNKGTIVNEAYKDDRFHKSIDMRTGYRTKSILCAPLRTVSGEIIGATQLLNKINSKFTKKDLEMLESITEQATIAIQGHLVQKKMEDSRNKELEFMDIVSQISSELEFNSMLRKVMHHICTLLDAERSTLFINDEKTNELFSKIGEELNQEIRLPNHIGIAGHVFTTGESLNIPHAYADLRFNAKIDKELGFFTRSILCAPVTNKDGKIIGVSQVLNKRSGSFTDDDLKRLITFTTQISISIENATLFENIQGLMNYNESMLNSMTNGVITINEDGLIEKCNPACMRLMKLENEEEIINKKIKDVLKRKNKWLVEKFKNVIADEYIAGAELEFGGEKISSNLTIMPLAGKEGESMGTILMIEDVSSEKRMKSTMSRYMDANLAEQLMESGENVLGGNESIGTVLFSDIRSFTTLTEDLGAQGTVQFLNEYFEIMVDCIQEEGGMLDKFIGDAIMAIFGTPIAHDDDPDRGVRAAIQMMTKLYKYNEKRVNLGNPPIDHGMGLNTDQIVSGNIGSAKRMDYTVIGDGVNLASRLESGCKEYGTHILISEYTFQALKATYRTRQVDKVIVKGKTVPVGAYEVLDYHTKDSFPNMIEVLEMFNNGIEYYNEGKWDNAIKQFKKAVKGNPEDKCSNMYVKRCELLKKADPKDWDGVWVAKSK